MNTLRKLTWNPAETPSDISLLLRTEAEEFPLTENGEGKRLSFQKLDGVETRVEVTESGDCVTIGYTTLAGAARGVGAALSGVTGSEDTPFTSLGFMLDVSRGMVMRVEHFKKWLRRLALGGCTLAMLYTEDTYELEGEPLFGFLRGRYTLKDMQEIDEYARALGIEMVGCIQTLGHLHEMLKWEHYSHLADTPNILLADDPKTYEFIEKMIVFWSTAFKSRRIHVGMDETHGLGKGTHQEKKGPESGFDIINRHLGKVNEICGKYGLDPMMWGDMYFRYGSKVGANTIVAGSYYDLESVIPEEVSSKIPKNVQLVYWDYYHQDIDMYLGMIRKHRQIGCEPIMGSGVWTWAQPWYNHPQTAAAVVPCIQACRQEKVKELFFTMWGDDGGYCNYDSSLAGLFYAMDLAFGCTDAAKTAARFDAICRSDYQAHLDMASIMEHWIAPENGIWHDMFLLWDDPLNGLVFDSVNRVNKDFDLAYRKQCAEIHAKLAPLKDVDGAGDFRYALALLEAWDAKLAFRRAFEEAYDGKDNDALRKVQTVLIPKAIEAIRTVADAFRTQWLAVARPSCLEINQQRFGGQLLRLEETARRIGEYLDGKEKTIPELDARLTADDPLIAINGARRACSCYSI